MLSAFNKHNKLMFEAQDGNGEFVKYSFIYCLIFLNKCDTVFGTVVIKRFQTFLKTFYGFKYFNDKYCTLA